MAAAKAWRPLSVNAAEQHVPAGWLVARARLGRELGNASAFAQVTGSGLRHVKIVRVFELVLLNSGPPTELADLRARRDSGVLVPGLSGLISQLGAWLGLWWCGLRGEFDGDGFEFGDELAQAAVGGEVGAEPFGVFGGEGPGDGAGAVEAYRFRRHLYYATCAILVSTPSSYSEGVR